MNGNTKSLQQGSSQRLDKIFKKSTNLSKKFKWTRMRGKEKNCKRENRSWSGWRRQCHGHETGSLVFIDDVTADQSSRMNTGDVHRAILCSDSGKFKWRNGILFNGRETHKQGQTERSCSRTHIILFFEFYVLNFYLDILSSWLKVQQAASI